MRQGGFSSRPTTGSVRPSPNGSATTRNSGRPLEPSSGRLSGERSLPWPCRPSRSRSAGGRSAPRRSSWSFWFALVTPGQASTEVRLPAPAGYAILLKEPEQVRRLIGPGEVLFHPQDPTRAFTVERIEAGGLLLREGPRGRVQALRTGAPPLPGFPGWRFAGTVLLQELHYRYKVVDRILHPDPVLVALEGLRAILEVEVLHSAGPVSGGSAKEAAPAGSARAHYAAMSSRPPPPGRCQHDSPRYRSILVASGSQCSPLTLPVAFLLLPEVTPAGSTAPRGLSPGLRLPPPTSHGDRASFPGASPLPRAGTSCAPPGTR
jgi:hypothetical protein